MKRNNLFFLIPSLILGIYFLMSFYNVHPPSKILMDIGHGPIFWKDPYKMPPNSKSFNRVKYMTDELNKTLSNVDGILSYNYDAITLEELKDVKVLFIHMPSKQFTSEEVYNIQKFVEKGGSLFLVMDVDYWSSLEQTNVNQILKPFDIHYEGEIPDTSSGGYSTVNTINSKSLQLSYHGGRTIKGGTPFCYSNQTKDFPFGVYKELKKGKLIVMGDGMVSLYMTSWDGVEGYQCQEFMQEVFKWLLK